MADWNPHANELFLEALERPAGPLRAAFLAEACRDDEALKAQVVELLNGNDRAGDFLSSPAQELPPFAFAAPRSEQLGTIIGPYKLLQEIGEGGMGVVYMAEQSQPVRRTVALKILKPGMDSRQVAARFEAERQALAMMDHPNIAKVFDAGTIEEGIRCQASGVSKEQPALCPTPDTRHLTPNIGRPYFVMELVKGISITKYCDEHRLTPKERLQLFLPVCQAVQHAHQKGIIHRDLKPSNVMVARYDGQPVPKVIDFGVAKATGPRLTEQTLFTEFGAVIGTLEYMSPEQAELNQLDVDTRSDVYSLGVLLYELLTGTTPLERNRSQDSSIMDVLRLIREETPPSPSTRISTNEGLPTIAANRGVESSKLSGLVRGELDWVVMKALEKDRNRRYPTASSLASDIERYLANEPVEACPPSAAYRVRLFVRRNKAAMIVAAVVAASLVLTTIISLWQASQARRAELLAEERRQQAMNTTELLRQMLHTASPGAAKGADYTVRQMLDDFSQRLDNQLSDQPAVEATIRATIGQAYWQMEQHDRAEPHLKAALELRKRAFGSVSAEVADSLIDYAWCVGRRDTAEMEKLAREALAMLRSLNVPADSTIRPLTALMFSTIRRGKTQERDKCVAQILAIEPRNPRDQAEVARALHWMADQEILDRDFGEAERLARESLIRHRKFEGEHHPETAWCLNTLALSLQGQGQLDDAEAMYRQALTIFREHYEEHQYPIVKLSANLLPIAIANEDQTAIDEIRTTAESALEHVNSDSNELYESARIFRRLQQLEQAERCFARIADLHAKDMQARYYVALLRLHRGDQDGYRVACQEALAKAEQLSDARGQYLAAWSALLGPDSGFEIERAVKLANKAFEPNPNDSTYRQAAGIALYRAGRYVEAHDLLLACIEADSKDDSKSLLVRYSRLFLAMTEQRLNRTKDAEQSLREALPDVDATLQNPDVTWDRQLTLKLWRDEAERVVVLSGHQEAAAQEPKP